VSSSDAELTTTDSPRNYSTVPVRAPHDVRDERPPIGRRMHANTHKTTTQGPHTTTVSVRRTAQTYASSAVQVQTRNCSHPEHPEARPPYRAPRARDAPSPSARGPSTSSSTSKRACGTRWVGIVVVGPSRSLDKGETFFRAGASLRASSAASDNQGIGGKIPALRAVRLTIPI
jgi:hypothetical protein